MKDRHISLPQIQRVMDSFDMLYPVSNLAYSIRAMDRTFKTVFDFLKPVQISACNMTTEKRMALEFGGVKLYTDDTIPPGTIRVYNKDGELLQEIVGIGLVADGDDGPEADG